MRARLLPLVDAPAPSPCAGASRLEPLDDPGSRPPASSVGRVIYTHTHTHIYIYTLQYANTLTHPCMPVVTNGSWPC